VLIASRIDFRVAMISAKRALFCGRFSESKKTKRSKHECNRSLKNAGCSRVEKSKGDPEEEKREENDDDLFQTELHCKLRGRLLMRFLAIVWLACLHVELCKLLEPENKNVLSLSHGEIC
jgi:hypothetical protein